MAYGTFVAHLEHADAGGSANEAQISFDIEPSSYSSAAYAAARIVGYLGSWCASYGAAGSTLTGIDYTAWGSGGAIALPFPTAAYADVLAVFPGLPDADGWGYAYGGTGTLTPIGTSVLVREATSSPARRAKGRHYLPFVGADAVTTAGQLGSAVALNITDNYGYMFLGQSLGGDSIAAVNTLVVSRKFNQQLAIQSVGCSPILSNLRSRRR